MVSSMHGCGIKIQYCYAYPYYVCPPAHAGMRCNMCVLCDKHAIFIYDTPPPSCPAESCILRQGTWRLSQGFNQASSNLLFLLDY